LAQRGSVESSSLHAPDAQVAQPGTHLSRRAGGERHRKDLSRRDMAGTDQLGNPPGDGSGLSGASTSQHTDWTPRRAHHRTLLLVETLEKIPVV
jgi:hypothetical protein